MTSAGIDGRLLAAADAILRARPPRDGLPPPSLPEYLSQHCHELLSSYPTSIAEDEALLRSAAGTAEPLRTALRYRLAKKRTLDCVLKSLGSSARSPSM